MGQAVHIVQQGNLTDVPPGSQAVLAASNLCVCNPSFSAANVTTLRGIAQAGALVGPSYNCQGVQQTAGAFYDAYRAKFEAEFYFPGSVFIPGTTPPNLLRAIRPRYRMGLRHADILADQMAGFGWDFLYLDDSPSSQDAGVIAALAPLWGIGSGVPAIQLHLQRWTEYLEAFQERIDARGILVLSNCAARPNPGFTGYTVEAAAGVPAALATFERTTNPGLNVAWFFAPPLEVIAVCHKGVLQIV